MKSFNIHDILATGRDDKSKTAEQLRDEDVFNRLGVGNFPEEEKHSVKKAAPNTLKEHRAAMAGITDAVGDVSNGFKATGVVKNTFTRVTQLSRYRAQNRMDMAAKSIGGVTDITLVDGRQCRFAGKSIRPGTEIYAVVPDGLELITDGTFHTSVRSNAIPDTKIHIKAGKCI